MTKAIEGAVSGIVPTEEQVAARGQLVKAAEALAEEFSDPYFATAESAIGAVWALEDAALRYAQSRGLRMPDKSEYQAPGDS